MSHWRTTHGLSRTPTYSSWDHMVQRITNPKNPKFPIYGGRGIDMDPRWKKFSVFLADMGERPKGMSIERKNNEQGYWPKNCCWASMKAQRNNTRSNLLLTARGKTQTCMQWAEELGIHQNTMRYRIRAGWPPEQVLREEVDSRLRIVK